MNDSIIIQVYQRLQAPVRVSADDILVDSTLRDRFVSECQHLLGAVSEVQVLRRLLNLRKRRHLPARATTNLTA